MLIRESRFRAVISLLFWLCASPPLVLGDGYDYNLRLELSVAPTAPPDSIARVSLSDGGSAASVRVELHRNSMCVTRAEEEIWRGAVELGPGKHLLMLKQRGTRTTFCLDATRLVELALGLSPNLQCAIQSSDGIRVLSQPRVQRVEPILLSDDFARTGQDDLQWEIVSGRFAVNASLNPSSAQSAFEFWGRAENRGIALAANSHWFWDDYRLDLSAKAPQLPATWSAVFYWVDSDNYHFVRWTQEPNSPGRIEWGRRLKGKEELLAAKALSMRPDQWYRLTVLVHGIKVRVFVCGKPALEGVDATLSCGRVGLLVEKTRNIYFDDLRVESLGSECERPDWQLPSPFGPGEKQWSDFGQKRFAHDSDMLHWSRPRSFWQPGASGDMQWFRTRFFHDVRFRWKRSTGAPLSWPQHPIRVILFGSRNDPRRGYKFEISPEGVTVTKGEQILARKTQPISSLSALECGAGPGGIEMNVNHVPFMHLQDAEPLSVGEVGADLGGIISPQRFGHVPHRWDGSDWRDEAIVVSSHRLDYGFDDAPTAWEIQAGRWRSSHRWACVPEWSFFGGRGLPSPFSSNYDCAILWNRRRVRGDFDFEVFFAPMEASSQGVHFSWPMTLNVAFAADGHNLDSGYLVIFGLHDLPTRLFRAGVPVASWSEWVRPAMRREWYTLYRRVTRVWQHLRVQRRGAKVEVEIGQTDDNGNYLGLVKVIEFVDPAPLAGDRFGLWTWGANGMAVARAILSFAESPGIAFADKPPFAHQNVWVETVEEMPGKPPFFRIHNACSGGTFLYDLAASPIDLERTGTIEFAHRIGSEIAVSLFAKVRGQVGQVLLTGRNDFIESAIPLGRCEERESEVKWKIARFDLLRAFRAVFPTGPLIADRIGLASPFETEAEIAGLGLNREGATYDLANVRFIPSPQPPAAVISVPRIRVHGIAPMDDFERDMGEWQRLGGVDGAALFRDPRAPASGRYSLRMLNEELGGPAGAWICQTPYLVSRFPIISFDYRWPGDVELNLLVRADGRWFEIQATGTDSSWPIIGRFVGFQPDGRWHSVEFDLHSALRGILNKDDLRVEALAFADTRRMSTRQGAVYWIDNFCRVPALDPEGICSFEFEWHGEDKPIAFSHIFDEKPDTQPPPRPTGEGARLTIKGDPGGKFLHVRVRDAQGNWSETAHLPVVVRKLESPPPPPLKPTMQRKAGPPPAPYVSYIPSDRLCRNSFEWSESPHWPEKELGEFRIRRHAWVLPCSDDAATGQGCVEILNLDPTEFYSAYFRYTEYDPARWPRVAFDYKFEQPGCALNLSLLLNDAMAIVEWTGRNPPGGHFFSAVIGRTEEVKQDGEWHHTEFDLFDMICRARFPDPDRRVDIRVAELATWATTHSRRGGYQNPLGARLKIDNFTIYSPTGRNPAFEWRVHGVSAPIKGYSYVFDSKPDTIPESIIITQNTRAEFNDVKPGRWHFHVRACDVDGQWGATTHIPIEIR